MENEKLKKTVHEIFSEDEIEYDEIIDIQIAYEGIKTEYSGTRNGAAKLIVRHTNKKEIERTNLEAQVNNKSLLCKFGILNKKSIRPLNHIFNTEILDGRLLKFLLEKL